MSLYPLSFESRIRYKSTRESKEIDDTFRVLRSLNASSSNIVTMNKFREIECLDLTNSTRCNIRIPLERSVLTVKKTGD